MSTKNDTYNLHNGSEELRLEEHRRLLKKIDADFLSDSCCEICHCDCYITKRDKYTCTDCADCDDLLFNYLDNNNNKCKRPNRSKTQQQIKHKRKLSASAGRTTTPTKAKRRSHSAGSTTMRLSHKMKSPCLTRRSRLSNYKRDCDILQNIASAFNTTNTLPSIHHNNNNNNIDIKNKQLFQQPALCVQKCKLQEPALSMSSRLSPLKLCASMSTLCLQPSVRQAFEQVPEHDQKILNRMAAKRSEQVAAKENAWLARRFWENERYERELLKYEQMEEFKQAVRDKQFQDYMLTKARLKDLAQRDLNEVQRLRECLQQKEVKTREVLENLSIERELKRNMRRCRELNKLEAAAMQQEQQEVGELLRRQNSYERLRQRLKRAEHTRTELLDAHLRRLRYDNQVAQLLHEEHLRETLKMQEVKQMQLQDQICRKRWRTQQFTQERQQRNEALAKTAKLSASLRELVRNSVTPDTLTGIK